MRTNKFYLPWQVVRVNAKKEKDVSKKIELVKAFLDRYPTFSNFERVNNWIHTTSYAYKDRKPFQDFFEYASTKSYVGREVPEDFSKYSVRDLQEVLNDLNTRKYSFMFEGNIPKEHIEFVDKLKKELLRRGAK